MGHNLRTYQIPAGSLIQVIRTIYGTDIGPIFFGSHGIVIAHTNMMILDVMWLGGRVVFDDYENTGTKSGFARLTKNHLSTDVSGFCEEITVVSMPAGKKLENW